MRKLLSTLILSCAFLFANAQTDNWCGSQDILKHQISTNIRLAEALKDLDSEDNTNYRPKVGDEVLVIPVVVHVVYHDSGKNISDKQIIAQIAGLNHDYVKTNADTSVVPDEFKNIVGNMNIQFKLATKDPYGLPTNGITRTRTDEKYFLYIDKQNYVKRDGIGKAAWNTRQYLNIWICELAGVRGYGQFPNGDILTDGVVIDFDWIGVFTPSIGVVNNASLINFGYYRVLTHEIGHWLGLYHIWGHKSCGNDRIKDTPKQETPHWDCYEEIVTCKSTDLPVNYMDYLPPECMVMFTQDQVNRAWKTLKKYRKDIKKSNNKKLTE